MKWWRATEERLADEEKVEDYKRQVQISPLQVFLPDLYERIFDPNYIPPEKLEHPELGFVTPTSDEEMEAMLAEWEGVGGLDMSEVFEPVDVNTLGQEAWWSPDED